MDKNRIDNRLTAISEYEAWKLSKMPVREPRKEYKGISTAEITEALEEYSKVHNLLLISKVCEAYGIQIKSMVEPTVAKIETVLDDKAGLETKESKLLSIPPFENS